MVRRTEWYTEAKEEKGRPWENRSLEVSQDIRTRLQQRGDLRRLEGVIPARGSSCNLGVRGESMLHVSKGTMNYREYTLGWIYKKDEDEGC